MNRKAKLLLVDDHAVVRAGFRLLLAASPNIDVVAEAERGERALQLYQESRPDIVVMDLSMPGIGGLETIRRIVQRDAAANILVFSVHNEQVYVHRALKAGAKGYITKNSAPDILSAAIETILDGRTYIEEGLVHDASDQAARHDCREIMGTLSAREFDVFRLLAKGLTGHKIAEELCLSYKTVANYSTQIKKKLHVSSVAELARIASALGVMEY